MLAELSQYSAGAGKMSRKSLKMTGLPVCSWHFLIAWGWLVQAPVFDRWAGRNAPAGASGFSNFSPSCLFDGDGVFSLGVCHVLTCVNRGIT
jgi:hypothetical protein